MINNANKNKSWLMINSLLLLSQRSVAAGSYNIGDETQEGFKLIQDFLQTYVNFMTGPFAHAAIAISLIAGVVIWVAMPKEGLFGIVFRIVVAGIVCLNIATWMNMFGE